MKTIAIFFFFFLNDPATTEFSPLPLHDALPISLPPRVTTWSVLVSAPDIRSAAVGIGRTQVTPADIVQATLSFANLGSEAARDLWVNLTLGPEIGRAHV